MQLTSNFNPVALVTEPAPASELPGAGEKTAASDLDQEQDNSGAIIRDIQRFAKFKNRPTFR